MTLFEQHTQESTHGGIRGWIGKRVHHFGGRRAATCVDDVHDLPLSSGEGRGLGRSHGSSWMLKIQQGARELAWRAFSAIVEGVRIVRRQGSRSQESGGRRQGVSGSRLQERTPGASRDPYALTPPGSSLLTPDPYLTAIGEAVRSGM